MFDVSIFVTELFAALQLEILIKIRPLVFRAFSSMFFAVFSMFERSRNDPEQEVPSIENLFKAIRLGSVLIYKHQLLRLEGRLPPDPIAPAGGPAFTDSVGDMVRGTVLMSFDLFQLIRQEANRPQVKQQLFQYNRFIKENPGVISLLHLVVIGSFSLIDVIQLLLETGADPNAVDIYGNTPLHLLALNCELEDRTAVAQLLLDAGCHFDQVNANGETALSLSKKPQGAQVHPFVEIVPSLFCCCAQVIAKHKIPFKHEEIPTAVQSDVELHVARGPQSSWYWDYFKLQLP